jgi:hypothetical protein
MSKREVVKRLLRFGAYERTRSRTLKSGPAERFYWKNSTAFLFGLIFNQGIP